MAEDLESTVARNFGPIRMVPVAGGPAAIGAAHGAMRSEGILRYAADRLEIVTAGTWSGAPLSADRALAIAESMLPSHERYAEDLYHEMVAMAGAAGLTPPEAVIVGGFTDFVDTVRGEAGAPMEDNCTAIIVPGPVARDGHAMLGQTWDMHDSATEHVIMLDLRPDAGPGALVFTTEGCLGQIGMNEAGIAVGINNLTAASGTIGVTWPFVVRKILQQTDIDDAVECVLAADLAGAHNYLIVDATGEGVNIEAMPQGSAVTRVTHAPLVHTNHVTDDGVRAHEARRPSALSESSRARMARARELLDGHSEIGPERLMDITRDPEAVCQVSHEPYHIESCGAAVMRPASGDMWAVWGRPDRHDYEHFAMSRV